MTEKKTILPSLRNQYWKKVLVETEMVNKLLPNIPTGNITELNELVYAGVKLVSDKISKHLRNLNKNTKPGYKIRLLKVLQKIKYKRIWCDEKARIKQIPLLEEINQKILAKERKLKRCQLERELEELEIGGWIETIQIIALLRLASILRRVLETWGDLLSLRLQWNNINNNNNNNKGVPTE